MTEPKDTPNGAETEARRLPWVRPSYARMRAGDAEIGPNPDAADGVFTFS